MKVLKGFFSSECCSPNSFAQFLCMICKLIVSAQKEGKSLSSLQRKNIRLQGLPLLANSFGDYDHGAEITEGEEVTL